MPHQRKGSIKRYRNLFRAFNIGLAIIADLDCLIDGFEHLEPSEDCKKQRDVLLRAIDDYISKNNVTAALSSGDLRRMQDSVTLRGQYNSLKEIQQQWESGKVNTENFQSAVNSALTAFFGDEENKKRATVLARQDIPEVVSARRSLLALLRKSRVYLLDRGEIESYYPAEITGRDKPTRALNLCQKIDSRDKALALCDAIPIDGGETANELELILGEIFNSVSP